MANAVQRYITYRHRIYPTRKQTEILETQLAFACDLYNAGLQERRDAWRLRGVGRSYIEQAAELTDVRAEGLAPDGMNCWTQQNALKRLDLAFAAFFRRCKAGEKPGYPRFRSKRRYDSLAWSFNGHAGGVAIVAGRLVLQGIGHVKVKWHRAIPEGARLRTVTVARNASGWHASFSLEMDAMAPPLNGRPPVGLDLGIETFARLSTDEPIIGPRAARSGQRRLQLAERRKSRRKLGSTRRRKAVRMVARHHERVANVRRDHAHKAARALVSRFGLIGVENLNLLGLARGMLAKDVHDQGWGAFLNILRLKAEGAGVAVVEIDPRWTSQVCADCGALVPKKLSERVHRCPECGYVAHRDTNSARLVLQLALKGPGSGLQAPTAGSVSRAVA